MKHRSENVEMVVRSVPRRAGHPEAYDQYVEDVQTEKCTLAAIFAVVVDVS